MCGFVVMCVCVCDFCSDLFWEIQKVTVTQHDNWNVAWTFNRLHFSYSKFIWSSKYLCEDGQNCLELWSERNWICFDEALQYNRMMEKIEFYEGKLRFKMFSKTSIKFRLGCCYLLWGISWNWSCSCCCWLRRFIGHRIWWYRHCFRLGRNFEGLIESSRLRALIVSKTFTLFICYRKWLWTEMNKVNLTCAAKFF